MPGATPERPDDQSGQGDGSSAGHALQYRAAAGADPGSSRNETIANQTPAARRVAAVQRTLTEYGYGQLKPTGTVGSDTQAAIQKFERERKLPGDRAGVRPAADANSPR